MSWWKAKKKRRLEAEFRRNTIRLHEGSKKDKRQENQSKSWHEDVKYGITGCGVFNRRIQN